MKQYLFGGPMDGMVISTKQYAALPILQLANYSIAGEPTSIELYELRPRDRQDRRYHCGSKPYPRPGAAP